MITSKGVGAGSERGWCIYVGIRIQSEYKVSTFIDV